MLEAGCADIGPFPHMWGVNGGHACLGHSLEGAVHVADLQADVQELGRGCRYSTSTDRPWPRCFGMAASPTSKLRAGM